MKKFFGTLFLMIFLAVAGRAQIVATWTQGVIPLPATPAVCTPGMGQVVFNTATNGMLVCTGVNQWRPAGVTGNSFDLAQGTITAQDPAINTTATWNAGAVTFTHWFANVTNTASAAGSMLIDLQVGGTTQFNVTTAGVLTVGSGGWLEVDTRSQLRSAGDGRFNMTDQAGTGLVELTFGPESNAFVRIEPISAGGVGQGFKFEHGDGTDVLFADLGAATNGTVIYCADCTKATPCAAAGNGALAKRLNGAWDCD